MQPPTLSEATGPAQVGAAQSTDGGSTDDEQYDDADDGSGDPQRADDRGTAPSLARRFAEGTRDPATDGSDPASPEAGSDRRSVSVETGALLEVLEDEYARRILGAVAETPRPARELMDICDASRATVYRRLNRLEEVELVRSRTAIHPDGHHRKVFEATLERATIELDGGDVTAEVTVAAPQEGAAVSGAAGMAPADD